MVSILVLVEVLPWAGGALLPGFVVRVSILVLVEVLPWEREGRSTRPAKYLFQSLFWWKYCPGLDPELGRCSRTVEFQSLFWWKYCPGNMPSALGGTTNICFNPCSGGSIALGVYPFRIRTQYPRMFQSLFWWKYCPGQANTFQAGEMSKVSILVLVEVLPWGSGRCSMSSTVPRFNPCSGGSIALGRLQFILFLTPGIMFQSLFWWKYCPGSILCISFEIATGYMNRLRLKISI